MLIGGFECSGIRIRGAKGEEQAENSEEDNVQGRKDYVSTITVGIKER